MMNLAKFQTNLVENNDNLYLSFLLGENNYAIRIQNVVEVIKMPLLDYPQRLPNNAIGVFQYNNFNLTVLDLRFYFNINVTEYTIFNQLLIVKTDESMFGLIIDKAGSIISLDNTRFESLSANNEEKIIESMYKQNQGETVSVINLDILESTLRKGVESVDIDIPSLFPKDDDSKYVLTQRRQLIQDKANSILSANLFSQNKYISFSLSENFYCISLEYIKEFLKDVAITNIPCSASYVAGIIPLQGNFITIIDIENFLNPSITKETNKFGTKNNIIILEFAEYIVGFIVNELFGIIEIPEEQIEINNRVTDKYVLSEAFIDDKMFNILNIKTIFSDEKFFIEE